MKTKFSKVLNVIENRYNHSKEFFEVVHEYKCNLASTWHAIIVEDYDSNTCYLATWCNNDYSTIYTTQYEGTLNPQALTDLYEFILS